MNRGNNSSFLSQTQREPGQDLAPLPMRGCPSSSPCSRCLGVSVAFNQLQFGHFSPCRMAGLDFSRYKTVRSLHTPMAGVAWREEPCLAFAGRGDTRRFVECMVTHWGCSSVDEERRVQASAPCTAALQLSLQHCSTAWHSAGALCLPRPFWGQAPSSHTSPHILSSGNKGTVR